MEKSEISMGDFSLALTADGEAAVATEMTSVTGTKNEVQLYMNIEPASKDGNLCRDAAILGQLSAFVRVCFCHLSDCLACAFIDQLLF